MANQRTPIIKAVIAAIVASGAVSNRVKRGRRNTIASGDFPAAFVYPIREEVTPETMAEPTRLYSRALSICVDLWSKQATPEILEESFDEIALMVETAVLTMAMPASVGDIVLTSNEWAYEATEDQPFGCIRLGFTLTYNQRH